MIRLNWEKILSKTKSGCRRIHSNSASLKIDNGCLYLLVDLQYKRNNRKWEDSNRQQYINAITKVYGEKLLCDFIYMNTNYKVKKDYLNKSVEFTLEVLNNMTQNVFQNKYLKRSNEDFLIDVVEGKLAEYVFNDFCMNYFETAFEIDNNIYESTIQTDGGNDLLIIKDNSNKKYINNLKIDIKSSKSRQ